MSNSKLSHKSKFKFIFIFFCWADSSIPVCLQLKETINLIDAGFVVNVPYPSFLGDRRDIDLIIAPENSAGEMFEVAQKCIYVCLRCGTPLIRFWTILLTVNRPVTTTDLTAWLRHSEQSFFHANFTLSLIEFKHGPMKAFLPAPVGYRWHRMTFTSSCIPHLHPSDSDSGQRLRSCSQEAFPGGRWKNPGGERLA